MVTSMWRRAEIIVWAKDTVRRFSGGRCMVMTWTVGAGVVIVRCSKVGWDMSGAGGGGPGELFFSWVSRPWVETQSSISTGGGKGMTADATGIGVYWRGLDMRAIRITIILLLPGMSQWRFSGGCPVVGCGCRQSVSARSNPASPGWSVNHPPPSLLSIWRLGVRFRVEWVLGV